MGSESWSRRNSRYLERNTSLQNLLELCGDAHRFLCCSGGIVCTAVLKGISHFWAKPRDYWKIYRGPGFLDRRMIWIPPQPLHPLPETQRKSDKHRQLADGSGGDVVGESQIILWRESLVLLIWFNTLWSSLSPRDRGGGLVGGGGGVWPPHTQQGPLKLYPSLGWKLCKPHGLPTAGSADLPQAQGPEFVKAGNSPGGGEKTAFRPQGGEGVLLTNRSHAQNPEKESYKVEGGEKTAFRPEGEVRGSYKQTPQPIDRVL